MPVSVQTIVAALSIVAAVLTAGIAGAARGQAMEAGRIVICSGQGVVTLGIDAEGNPTGPAHWCPDCVLTLLAAAATAPPAAAVTEDAVAASCVSRVDRRPGGSLAEPQARGPPAL